MRQLYQKHLLPFEDFSGGITSDFGTPSHDCPKKKRPLPVVAAAAKGNDVRATSGEVEVDAADCLLEIRGSNEEWAEPPAKRQRLDSPGAGVEVSRICAQVFAA